jgi:hypothetical protein
MADWGDPSSIALILSSAAHLVNALKGNSVDSTEIKQEIQALRKDLGKITAQLDQVVGLVVELKHHIDLKFEKLVQDDLKGRIGSILDYTAVRLANKKTNQRWAIQQAFDLHIAARKVMYEDTAGSYQLVALAMSIENTIFRGFGRPLETQGVFAAYDAYFVGAMDPNIVGSIAYAKAEIENQNRALETRHNSFARPIACPFGDGLGWGEPDERPHKARVVDGNLASGYFETGTEIIIRNVHKPEGATVGCAVLGEAGRRGPNLNDEVRLYQENKKRLALLDAIMTTLAKFRAESTRLGKLKVDEKLVGVLTNLDAIPTEIH